MTTRLPAAPVYDVDPALATDVLAGRPTATATLASQLRARESRHLAHRPGYLVLSGLGHLDQSAARQFVLAVSAILGTPLPQDFDGEMVREVRDRGVTLEDHATARYSDTRQGGHLHTDGMHRPGEIPAYFALHCVRQAASGGALVLIHVDDLVRELSREPEVMTALRQPVHFDTRDGRPDRPATVPRSILEIDGTGMRITYLREYIESAHRKPGIPPLSPTQVTAMDRLDALLDRADLRTHRRLEPGQLIVINNRVVVHGRTSFEDDPRAGRGRLLLRTWIGGTARR